MLKLIKNAEVYTPERSGCQDVLIVGSKIGKIAPDLALPPPGFIEVEVIDGRDKILAPGFIDGHVHITGGGGEGGFATRTPEAVLSQITRHGVTTLIGCLGTDGTTRHMHALLAKARGLEEEGITTYIYTGSYEIPVRTITDCARNDIILIDKVIGIGEIAISDHRSAQPTKQELARLAAEARVGGMLSGKAGVLHLHVGDGERKLDDIIAIVNETEIPVTQIIPTHVNRNRPLFEQAIAYAGMGGIVDLTSSIYPVRSGDPDIKASTALRIMLERGVNESNITMSSDGYGSAPIFDRQGRLIRLGVGSLAENHRQLCDGVFKERIPLATALKPLTSSVADALKLSARKGRIAEGLDADILLLQQSDLSIDTVIAGGKIMVRHGQPVVFGSFEEAD